VETSHSLYPRFNPIYPPDGEKRRRYVVLQRHSTGLEVERVTRRCLAEESRLEFAQRLSPYHILTAGRDAVILHRIL